MQFSICFKYGMNHRSPNLLILIGLLIWSCLWRKVHRVPDVTLRHRLGLRASGRHLPPGSRRPRRCAICSYLAPPGAPHGRSLGAAQLVLGRQSRSLHFSIPGSPIPTTTPAWNVFMQKRSATTPASSITGRFRCNSHCAVDLTAESSARVSCWPPSACSRCALSLAAGCCSPPWSLRSRPTSIPGPVS